MNNRDPSSIVGGPKREQVVLKSTGAAKPWLKEKNATEGTTGRVASSPFQAKTPVSNTTPSTKSSSTTPSWKTKKVGTTSIASPPTKNAAISEGRKAFAKPVNSSATGTPLLERTRQSNVQY